MKKIVTMAVAAAFAGLAVADISINFENLGTTVNAAGGGFVNQALAQLIWTAAPVQTQGNPDGALNAGEVLLAEVTTTVGYAGTWSDQPMVVRGTDAGVGGVVADGNFFVRIYDVDAMAKDDYFLQQFVTEGPLVEFAKPSDIYQTNGLLGGDIDAQGYQIVPEPATIGLMGIAGLGMFLARRKNRC